MIFSLEEEGTALRAESSLLCLPYVHSALLSLGRPVNTCGQDDNQDADNLDEGDCGDLAHGDVERGELAQGEEGGETAVVPGQPCRPGWQFYTVLQLAWQIQLRELQAGGGQRGEEVGCVLGFIVIIVVIITTITVVVLVVILVIKKISPR